MAMSKRDESNKEKTTSSYNLPSTPISSAATINTSQLASTTYTTQANAYQPPIPFPNNEEPRATSHQPHSDPRSTNQGSKHDAQAVADLLALADASSNSPPSHEEPQRPSSLKRPASESQSPPDAGNKKMKLMPPSAGPKKQQPRPPGEPYQFVHYSPKPPQTTKRKDVIPDEPTHSTPSPGTTVSHVTRPSTSPTTMTAPSQPPHMRPAAYTQISTIAPGPFSPTAAPHLYSPHISSPVGLTQVPAPTNIVPPPLMIMTPWPAVGPTNYQIAPQMPPQQQYFGPPLSLEQLVHQRLQNINYPSGTEYRLIKRCLPDQPLNFFKTDVVPSQAPSIPGPHNILRPFKEPTSEAAAAPIEPLPHLPQLIQTLEVPFEAQRSAGAPQADNTRGPPKKLPLHLLQ